MLAIVASAHDTGARDLAIRWRCHDAAVLSCEDLTARGWRYYAGRCGTSTAVIGGRTVSERVIDGVLTRRPWIFERELHHVAQEDREFCAAECNAFMLAWLTSLRCPVLNAPTPTSLAGPAWRPLQWRRLAAQLGIPIDAHSSPDQDNCALITVIGKAAFGCDDPTLTAPAIRLAAAAGTAVLSVRFRLKDDVRFVTASPWPDLRDDTICRAVERELLQR
jgi:hypothetical protein